MESLINGLFLHQWQRKLLALVTASVIWFFVSHTITETKTIPSIPIRLVNIPSDKTSAGLLSNGFLMKRISVTITGTKDVIEQIEPGDLEVVLDAAHLSNESVVQITKKNVINLNPNIDFSKHIQSITAPDFTIRISPLITEKIPITILPPSGTPPSGYQFVDIWPSTLYQQVSGPHDQVLDLKKQGYELTFNLNDISKEELEEISKKYPPGQEVSFLIPDAWKKIPLPFLSKGMTSINDPLEKDLHITFLKEQMIPLKTQLPLYPFYPVINSDEINPQTYPLETSLYIQKRNDLFLLDLPLFVKNVSSLFLEVVENYLEIMVIASPKNERERLDWALVLVGEEQLEDTYVALESSRSKVSTYQDLFFRERFRSYKKKLALYLSKTQPLFIDSTLEDNKMSVYIPNIPKESKKKKTNAS